MVLVVGVVDLNMVVVVTKETDSLVVIVFFLVFVSTLLVKIGVVSGTVTSEFSRVSLSTLYSCSIVSSRLTPISFELKLFKLWWSDESSTFLKPLLGLEYDGTRTCWFFLWN